MNLSRDKAIEAMDTINTAGYSVNIDAVIIPKFSKDVLYRVSVIALSFEDTDLRALCDMTESIGLYCRFSLDAIRFESERHERECIR